MKHLKFLAIAFIALCFTVAAQAQTTKSKKEKTQKQEQTIKYQCPMKCEGEKTYAKEGKCPVCNMKLKATPATTASYQCPMGCEGEKTYAKEGKCPVCNMKLTKISTKKKMNSHDGHNHK